MLIFMANYRANTVCFYETLASETTEAFDAVKRCPRVKTGFSLISNLIVRKKTCLSLCALYQKLYDDSILRPEAKLVTFSRHSLGVDCQLLSWFLSLNHWNNYAGNKGKKRVKKRKKREKSWRSEKKLEKNHNRRKSFVKLKCQNGWSNEFLHRLPYARLHHSG